MRNSVKGAALASVSVLIASLFLVISAVTNSASAATYPPTTCATISVSTTTPQVGQTITVTGEQFVANSTVSLYLTPKSDYPAADAPASSSVLLKRLTVDANGSFSTTVTMPSDAAGNQIISADGQGKICPADPIQIKVSGSGAGGGSSTNSGGGNNGGGVAMTGVDVALLVAIAAALLGAGVLFARGGRRSRHAGARR